MKNNNLDLAQEIYQAAKNAGFDNCGIISLKDMDPYEEKLQERIDNVPESTNFYKGIQLKANLKKHFSWAKSLIICTTWYGKYQYPKKLQGKYAKGFFLSYESDKTNIIYKQSQTFKKWLDDHNIKWCDNQIFGLRYAAMQAGLGIIRTNNFFYDEKGSYLELTGFVIDKECRLYHNKQLKPCSQHCNLCIKNCPTKSLSKPYTMNPFKCISYCTTFGKGKVPDNIDENEFGSWIIGCDQCQDVCPFNRHDWNKGEIFPGLDELVTLLEPEVLLKTADEVLIDKIIPKTVNHIQSDDVSTLRKNATRFLNNNANRQT